MFEAKCILILLLIIGSQNKILFQYNSNSRKIHACGCGDGFKAEICAICCL